MDTVTYPNAIVKDELARWVLLRVNIREYSDVAQLFDIAAIPVAVAVSPEGMEWGHVENFVQPDEFQRRLSDLRRVREK